MITDFSSVLFGHGTVLHGAGGGDRGHEQPACFTDLNLDQLVASIVADFEEYDLAPLFWDRLTSEDAVAYRHEVFEDLEQPELVETVQRFAEQMRAMRRQLAQARTLRNGYQQAWWYLAATTTYRRAIEHLDGDLAGVELASRGLCGLRHFVQGYRASPRFSTLAEHQDRLWAALGTVKYCLRIHGSRIEVRLYDGEADYSQMVATTFEKFAQGEVTDRRVGFRSYPDLDHVEAAILDHVAQLHAETFALLVRHPAEHQDFLDPTIARFDREIQFYLAFRHWQRALERAGLTFCHPAVSVTSKAESVRGMFDAALAGKLAASARPVVANDYELDGPERALVISGPNQGGKTTFARAVGQIHFLAGLGVPVPAASARLFLCDRVFTQFERQEDMASHSGKLQDDLERMRGILEVATERSLVVMNELFASTTLHDARLLGRRILEQILDRDMLCVCVTFIDELSRLRPSTVSMVSSVVPDDPTVRTFRILRRPADGRAYALAIAERYGLTYEHMKARLAS